MHRARSNNALPLMVMNPPPPPLMTHPYYSKGIVGPHLSWRRHLVDLFVRGLELLVQQRLAHREGLALCVRLLELQLRALERRLRVELGRWGVGDAADIIRRNGVNVVCM